MWHESGGWMDVSDLLEFKKKYKHFCKFSVDIQEKKIDLAICVLCPRRKAV